MRLVGQIVLYTALVLGANGLAAEPAALGPLLQGDMRKLVLVETPGQPVEAELTDAEDGTHRLSDWRGKYVLVNFWATWCAPCRAELGALDRLQAEHGGERFDVLTVATGPNPLPAIRKLFGEIGVTHLPILRDPKQRFAREMGVMGLPVSVLIDPEGREIGRLIGDAEWDGPEALALIGALTAAE